MTTHTAIALALLLGAGVAHAQDCNDNGIPDADEIALDPDLDCDNNGVLDWCQTRPIIDHTFETASPIGFTDPTLLSLETLPEAAIDPVADAGASVTLELRATGDFSSPVEFVDIIIMGQVVATAFNTVLVDCQPTMATVQIPAGTFEAARLAGAPIELVYSMFVDKVTCPGSSITPRVVYRTVDRTLDADGDAVLDACDPCRADFSEPRGQLDFRDITGFLAAFFAGSLRADIAEPRGVLTFADITGFIQLYLDDCP